MTAAQRRTLWIISLLVAIFVCSLAVICRQLLKSEKIYLLSDDGSAHWILFPKALDGKLHKSMQLDAEFVRNFSLTEVPATATLTLRALKKYSVVINGASVDSPDNSPPSWKETTSFDVSKQLRPGTNFLKVTVSNSDGPPALCLTLNAGKTQIFTDDAWQVSQAGSVWCSARQATDKVKIQPGNPLFGGESTLASFLKNAPQIFICALLVAGLLVLARRFHNRHFAANEPEKPVVPLKFAIIAFSVVAAFLSILFLNNLRLLPNTVGFDATNHLAYIDHIRKHWSLPLADQGWQMYQPPLYYVISACLLSPLQSGTASDTAVIILRLFGLLALLFQVGFTFLSIRLLFPNRIGVQIFGLILAAVLPENLYIFHYITNEGLSATLASGTIYFCLRLLHTEVFSAKSSIALGLFLGAALLTKVTAIILVPCVFGCLVIKGLVGRNASFKSQLGNQAIISVVCLMVCGWYYGRVWNRFGTPLVGNWDTLSGYQWWMEDGFRTAGYYSHFGRSLTHPLFSGVHSFADGLYSTLWGDALCGGAVFLDYRPPWNYSLMTANYFLAVIPTLLILAGGFLAFHRWRRQQNIGWLILVGITCCTLTAIIYMSLKLPSYGQVKAFYGLIAALPLCALGTLAWSHLEKRNQLFVMLCTILFGTWAINSYASFWVRSWSAETHLNLGQCLQKEGRLLEAGQQYSEALRLSPNNSRAKKLVALALLQSGKIAEARQLAEANCNQNSKNADAFYFLSILLAGVGETNQALTTAKQALQLAPEHPFVYESLSEWLANTGSNEEAIKIGREGLRVNPFSELLHFNLGSAFAGISDHTNAIIHFRYATILKPEWAEAQSMLAASFEASGNPGDAMRKAIEAVRLKPSDPELHRRLARLYLDSNHAPEAIKHLRTALDLNDEFAPAQNDLAWILATHPDIKVRKGKEALWLAKEACKSAVHPNPDFMTTLAAALAENEQYTEAASMAQTAFEMASKAGMQKLIEINGKMLLAFHSQRPYRFSNK